MMACKRKTGSNEGARKMSRFCSLPAQGPGSSVGVFWVLGMRASTDPLEMLRQSRWAVTSSHRRSLWCCYSAGSSCLCT